MESVPGKGGHSFKITLSENWFKKGDILLIGPTGRAIVTDHIKFRRLKLILNWLFNHYDISFQFIIWAVEIEAHS